MGAHQPRERSHEPHARAGRPARLQSSVKRTHGDEVTPNVDGSWQEGTRDWVGPRDDMRDTDRDRVQRYIDTWNVRGDREPVR